jgi:hypothetical protein
MHNPTLASMSDSSLRSFPGSYADINANLYDQQTAPILRKSLARTASTSSFHNGLAETRPPISRLDGVGLMSPAMGQLSAPSQTLRAAMHGRSITSPANSLSPPNPNASPSIVAPNGLNDATFLSDDEVEESFSDLDERLMAHQSTKISLAAPSRQDGTPSLESMIRSGMRRLTGGSAANREKERQREFLRAQQRAAAQTFHSPRVPKVPPEYLTGPASSPMPHGQP